ncbi:MAG: Ig domain-containing protein [Holophaga sp.]
MGKYSAMVRCKPLPQYRDDVAIKVHPAPVAKGLSADRTRIKPGETVKITPEFEGGTGILYPGQLEVASGTPVEVKPVQDTTYILRVTNTLGMVVEKTLVVRVDGDLRHLHNIVAPEVARIGNYHVAWVERRVGAQLEWSSDEVVFLGDEERPTTPVVVFTPRADVTTYRLKVKAKGGTELAPLDGPRRNRTAGGPSRAAQAGPAAVGRAGEVYPPAAEEVEFETSGRVERPTGEEPVIKLERPFLTAGKGGCKAWVENPRPGADHVWEGRHAQFEGPTQTPAGTQVVFTAGKGEYLLLTCTATLAGAPPHSTTTAVRLVAAPEPPVILVGAEPLAGARQWAYVKNLRPGETQHWEIDPAKGDLGPGRSTATGPLVGFTVREPGPFTLTCRTENQAGELSSPATLTLTAIGPYSLREPEIRWPEHMRADAPCTLEVVNASVGFTYEWRVTGGTPATTAGPRLDLRTGTGALLVVTCTARESATGAVSTVSRGYDLLRPPSRPRIQAPSPVSPNSPQVAGLINGGRPGETIEWRGANVTLRQGRAEDRGLVAVFDAGDPGEYTLTAVAVNAAGERSAPETFRGLVAVPGVLAPTGGGTAGPAPDTPPAGLHLAYDSIAVEQGVEIPAQAPILRNAVGTLRFTLDGELPQGLRWDPNTGIISGTPEAPCTRQFRMAVADATRTGLSNLTSYQVRARVAGPADGGGSGLDDGGDAALTLSYDGGVFQAGQEVPERLPQVRNAVGQRQFRIIQGGVPEGMTFNPDTGAISGTPRTPGMPVLRVELEDATGAGPRPTTWSSRWPARRTWRSAIPPRRCPCEPGKPSLG